ncbi:MAG: hypothetical protein PVG39_25360 [Desulfobacteraceae bacterium]|jgi:hypothetical protein
MEYLFIAWLIAAILYFFIIQLRRKRLKKLSERINGKYISKGLFKTGSIEGDFNKKQYILESNPKASVIFLQLEYNWITIGISSNFYHEFPNWKSAFSFGPRKERVFIKEINVGNGIIPLPDEYKEKVLEIFSQVRELYLSLEKQIGSGVLLFSDNNLRFVFRGKPYKPDKINSILKYMVAVEDKVIETKFTNFAEQMHLQGPGDKTPPGL